MVHAAALQVRCAAPIMRRTRAWTTLIRLTREFSRPRRQLRTGDAFTRVVLARCCFALLMLEPLAYSQALDPPPISMRISRAEWVQGNKLASKFDTHTSFISDPPVSAYVNDLEQRILKSSSNQGRYVVKVVADGEVNAFSLPGGFLYVHGGLLLAAENEAQLVAALGHETGHVAGRHMTGIESKKRVGKILAFVTGPAGFGFKKLAGRLLLLKMLRNAEFEADRLALQYQYASGYDPAQFVKLLQNTFPQEQHSGFYARLFDEHPLTGTRIKRAEQVIADCFRPKDYVLDTADFHRVKARVAAAMGVANPETAADRASKEAR